MTIDQIAFKQVSTIVPASNENNRGIHNKNKLEKSPIKDSYYKKNDNSKNKIKSSLTGMATALLLLYSSLVLKNKLSKPSLQEVQTCFKKIFNEDLDNSQINDLISKYKSICKNKDNESFAKELIDQLKKDYGISETVSNLNITSGVIKANKGKNGENLYKLGKTSPFGDIELFIDKDINKTTQQALFSNNIHELKHLKQFTMAYRTDPDKFAKAIFYNSKNENIQIFEQSLEEYAKNLIKGDVETCKKLTTINNCSLKEIQNMYKYKTVDQIKKEYRKYFNITTQEKLEEYLIKDIRKKLDSVYKNYKPFSKDSNEYKKGLEYIKGYKDYADPLKDYEAYTKNILEQEAFNNEKLAEKIHKYITAGSIWKI